MKFDDFEYHPSKLPSDPVKLQAFLEEKRKELVADLETNPRYQSYFSKYDPRSIPSFITMYSEHKKRLSANMDFYLRRLDDSKELRYRNSSEIIFWLIGQKKLFNMQCLWRAEKIEIDEVRLGAHFMYWEDRISECPFLEPITEQEVEVMKGFLRDNNYKDSTNSWLVGWQDYDEIVQRDSDDHYDMMPEWYEFYDGRMGTGYLYKLPDIRGGKEEFYMNILRERNRRELQNKPPVVPVHRLPMLNSIFSNHFTEFVNLFEDDYFKVLQKGADKMQEEYRRRDNNGMDQIEEALALLCEAEYPVYMPGGMVWNEAIIKCGQQYINTIIADELDVIYEEYTMLHQLGIRKTFTDIAEEYRKDGLCKMVEDQMLEARELNGEARDLNF